MTYEDKVARREALFEQMERHHLETAARAENLSLQKATVIVASIESYRAVQREIKAAFVGDELNGGPKGALTHPLYLLAQARIAELHEEMKELI